MFTNPDTMHFTEGHRMADALALLREYLELRLSGTSANQAVDALRARVELLNGADRADLVRQIREFEQQRAATGPARKPQATGYLNPDNAALIADVSAAVPQRRIKPLSSPSDTDPAPKFNGSGALVTCPNCHKRNRAGELFCFACGYVMKQDMAKFETVRLNDASVPSGDYFPPNGAVLLVQRGTNAQFQARPSDRPHDLVVGRADHTVLPDLDLSSVTGDVMSISRMHLSLRHNRQLNTLAAIDMGSANGSFINGQRLYPQEVRTLRHGDELRLGNLVFNVYFVQ